MANIPIKIPEEFIAELRKLETTDKNHADVFNALFSILINNDVYLKKHTDISDEHIKDTVIHVTQQDKDAWNKKAGTDVATQSKAGLESPEDKKKIDGIAEGAEVNQNAFSRIAVGDVIIIADGKESAFTLQAGDNVTISADNATKKIVIKANRDGGNADMLDGHHASSFANVSHSHSYAGSSSSGGAATSANKLNTNAGSSAQPVYFSNGVPVATTARGVMIQSSAPSNINTLWAW